MIKQIMMKHSGIDKGVKFLSETNIKIAFGFMLFIFLLGPTAFITRLFSNSLGIYLNNFISSSFFIATGNKEASSWQGDWSIFYLAWWISWSPFIGMFIARISKGRTIREFILAISHHYYHLFGYRSLVVLPFI